MPATRPIPAPAIRRRLASLLFAASLLVAACATGPGVTPVSIPPDAMASILPNDSAPPEASPTTEPAATFPLTLTDDEGTELQLNAPPQRIVSLTPANTEILFAIGAGDRVIATTDFDDFPAAAVALPDVASYTAIDIEQIVAMGADLVVAGGNSFNPPDQLAKLRSLGIPVLVVYARNVATVLADIELIGDAVGDGPAARELTALMQAGFDRVVAATEALPKPRTFYEIDTTGGIFGPSDESFLAEMIDLAGGDPITTGDPDKFDISLEKLVAADPEVIVLGDAAYGATPAIVKARPGWGTMTAVKTGAIRPSKDILITRPGPRLVEGLENLAVAIHPELASVLSTP
ncbi:MAG: helical backbone metal receptor [Chloroflexota bacterium]|nr:helical backbone metal receptor [Chloroflexota bacterium]